MVAAACHASIPVDGFIRGTMTGALLCSLGEVREELVEEEVGEEEGTPEDSLSPLFMARTEGPTLASTLLGFGTEFSERHNQNVTTTRLRHSVQRHETAARLTGRRINPCANNRCI